MRDNPLPLTPVLGMHCTKSSGSDCYPYEVIWLSKSKRRIIVRRLNSEPAPGHDYYNNQVYTYTSNPLSEDRTEYSLRKNGRYYPVGQPMGFGGLTMGHARYYHDPSF